MTYCVLRPAFFQPGWGESWLFLPTCLQPSVSSVHVLGCRFLEGSGLRVQGPPTTQTLLILSFLSLVVLSVGLAFRQVLSGFQHSLLLYGCRCPSTDLGSQERPLAIDRSCTPATQTGANVSAATVHSCISTSSATATCIATTRSM